MKDCRTLEFFEGPDQRLSMSALLKFCAFFPASVIAYKLNNADALLIYVGAFVLDSATTKLAGVFNKRIESKLVPSVEQTTTTTVEKKVKK